MAGDTPAAAVTVETLVVCVGGLGGSQMGSIIAAFRRVPTCHVIDATWTDQIDSLVALALRENPTLINIALIGHSFAAIPLLEFCASLTPSKADYLALLDPVSCKPFVSSWPLPADAPEFWWVRRGKFGVEIKMNVENAPPPEIIDDYHNAIPHRPDVVARLLADVAGL